MKRQLTYILLIFLSVTALADGRLRLYSHCISVKEGLLSNTVYELAQDQQGYIWMATSNGLSRYDGYTTVNYPSVSCNPKQPIEARIGRVAYDHQNGVVWLSTSTYVNACYDLRQARFVDWTGRGDMMRPLSKRCLSARGIWYYENGFGARFSDGRHCEDYTKENGRLPSNAVERIIEDRSDRVWIATGSGLVCVTQDGKPQTVINGHRIIACATGREQTYCLDEAGSVYACAGDAKLLSSRPAALPQVKKVNVSFVWQDRWMLFTPDGTFSVNIKDGTWREERGEAAIKGGLDQGSQNGYHFVADGSGRLWIFADDSRLKTLDLLSNSRFTGNKGRKFNIAARHDGRLFIATYGNGLFVWNAKTDQLDHFTAEDEHPVVNTNYLLYAISDRQDNIWVGSEEAGAYCLNIISNGEANHVLPEPGHRGDGANTVTAIGERNDSIIIIGTRDGGIYQYDPRADIIKKTLALPSSVRCLLIDSDSRLWIGTNDRGLYVEGTSYNEQDKTRHLPRNNVRAICQDSQGRVWIGVRDGGLLMTGGKNPAALSFRQFLTRDFNQRRVNTLAIDRQDILWIGTNDGLYRVDTRLDDFTEKDFKGYYADGNLPFSEINAIHTAEDGTLWVAAVGAGLLKCRFDSDGNLSYTKITRREGLASNTVYSMMSDSEGYLWVGTDAGLSRINARNGIVNTYQQHPTMQANITVEGSALQTRDGHLLFGTLYGMWAISPRSAQPYATGKGTALIKPVITDLRVNGLSYYENGTFQKALSDTKGIEFDPQDNSLSFYFSNFAFADIHASLYQYYLEGVDKTWGTSTTANHADYAELPPGRYVFHLRSLDADNNWTDEVLMEITIHHPWYLRWWAVLIYLLLAALFGWYVYRNWKEKFDLQQRMKLDRQLADFRTQLFTNITHEFRTPLSIIKGAVDKLSQNSGNTAALQTVQRGTSRLLRLVNQFMEYRKINTGNLRLQVEEGDIVTFVRDVYQDFLVMARQKDIQMTFQPFERHYRMPFDTQMVETIVYNLLSNAVKYTPEGGNIDVRLKHDDAIVIAVANTGPGISAEKQAELFKPFMHSYASQGGMGIGLYTAHQMAQLHKGALTHERLSDATLFTLTLPDSGDYYDDGDYRETNAIGQPSPGATQQPSPAAADIIREMQPEAYNDLTVAIIEDNPDMMQQIRQEVGVYFRTKGYSTGQAGYDGVIENPPALLLCDVMLPDTDGYQIASRLKSDPRTASLPIIMLTALDDEEHQIRAYRAGADDYMVKPCNFRLLIARAIQLIKWRQSAPVNDAEPASGGESNTAIITSQADKVFLKKLEILTAQHLTDSNLSIDTLAEMMNMGRTKFFGRVKEMTGLSPNKYLLKIRMEKAADLLADGEMNVSEVSYKVGIQDPSYFNKVFKSYYGVAPSKYVREAQ